MPALPNERDLDFLLDELLDIKARLRRERCAESSREFFNATLATSASDQGA